MTSRGDDEANDAAASGPSALAELQRRVRELDEQRIELEAENRALRESNERRDEALRRYVDMFDFAPVACCALDPFARIREANLAAAALFGLQRETLRAQPFLAVAALDDVPAFLAHLDRCRNDGVTTTLQIAFTPRGGQRVLMQMITTPIRCENDECEIHAAFLDVTEQHRAEQDRARLLAEAEAARREAERVSQLKDVFLAAVSHELRTPIAALLLWEDVLRAEPSDAETRARALDAIRHCAQAEARLIDDLLDVARGVSDKLRIDQDAVEIVPVVAAAVEAGEPAARARGLIVRTRLDPAAGFVLGDATRLGQIVSNLLSNAVKFTSRGGRIMVQAARVGSSVEISVRDTGRGIDPAYLPRVFVPFSQADTSTTREHGGLGLGLAIVRRLVEAHGGTVQAESAGLGQGATFVVTLPRLDITLPSSTARAANAITEQRADIAGLSLLVVDDEPSMRDGFAIVLRQAGAQVVTAASVPEALEAMDRTPFDMVIADLTLPGDDGYALLRQVRERPESRGGSTPVVALTAHARPEDRDQAMLAGFSAFIAKPTDAWHLIAAITRIANRVP